MHGTEAQNTQIRTAFDLRKAISNVSCSGSIGYSVTKLAKHQPPTPEQQQVLDQLQGVADAFPQPYKSGKFDTAFHLHVTRPGCEFDGKVTPKSPIITKLLPHWFDNAAVSGFGDMRALETKVDPTVRDAKEILATEFTVEPSFLEKIRDTWAKRFIPTNVRVEPYKIHLYGPGGHFESHRDTPEAGLDGNFRIGKEKLRAEACSWVAFHPDVPHKVTPMDKKEYRAIIAFKIFRSSTDEENAAWYRALEDRLVTVLADNGTLFGILLEHMYHTGVSQLNGFDAVLFTAARRMQHVQVHLLPVVITSNSTVYYDSDDENENSYSSLVYPFTSAHVDHILTSNPEAGEKIEWLNGIKMVPFYSWDFKTATMEWECDMQEINWTGNEADGESQYCVYLSHVLLILPEEDVGEAER